MNELSTILLEQFHHLSYERVGNERFSDLMVICDETGTSPRFSLTRSLAGCSQTRLDA